MKTLITSIALTLAFNVSFASNSPNLYLEIENQIRIVDLSDTELSSDHQEFVNVEFQVVDGRIVVLDLSGTNPSLEPIILKELSEVVVKANPCPDDTFIYKFVFEKR